jgi:hypothetical protein
MTSFGRGHTRTSCLWSPASGPVGTCPRRRVRCACCRRPTTRARHILRVGAALRVVVEQSGARGLASGARKAGTLALRAVRDGARSDGIPAPLPLSLFRKASAPVVAIGAHDDSRSAATITYEWRTERCNGSRNVKHAASKRLLSVRRIGEPLIEIQDWRTVDSLFRIVSFTIDRCADPLGNTRSATKRLIAASKGMNQTFYFVL